MMCTKTTVDRIYEDDFYEGPLLGLVDWAQEIVNSVPEEYRSVSVISTEGGAFTDENFRLEITRPMTKTEMEAEENRMKRIRQQTEDREKQQLEKLLKKYGNPVS